MQIHGVFDTYVNGNTYGYKPTNLTDVLNIETLEVNTDCCNGIQTTTKVWSYSFTSLTPGGLYFKTQNALNIETFHIHILCNHILLQWNTKTVDKQRLTNNGIQATEYKQQQNLGIIL